VTMVTDTVVSTDHGPARHESLPWTTSLHVVVVQPGPAVCTSGGTHEPFNADSCGQYWRRISINPPDGAGSQLGSCSAPGDAFRM
jgi:hypothetical protein